MLVHGPAAVGHRVVKDPVGQNVVGVQHVLSGEAAALPGAGQIAHPYQLVVLRPVVPAVLDVVPYAIDCFVQFPADILGGLDDVVPVASQLDPPIAGLHVVFLHQLVGVVLVILVGPQHYHVVGVMVDHDVAVVAMLEKALVKGVGPGGLDELHRSAGISGAEIDGITHGLAVGDRRRFLFVVGLPRLPADAVVRAGEIAQGAVAGGVDEDFGGEGIADLRSHLIALYGLDLALFGENAVHGSVHVAVQSLGGPDGGPEHRVPDRIVVVVVEILVFQLQLHKDAGLSGVFLAPVAGSAGDMHPGLRAGVAAIDAAVLDQGGLCAMTGRGNGRAHPAHSAAYHHHVIVLFHGGILRRRGFLMDIVFHRMTPLSKYGFYPR